MIEETFHSIPGIILSGYESLIDTFGSPYVLIAISTALVAAAAFELCIRKRRKNTEVA